MLCGRALLGVGIGMGFVVFPTYMAEVSPARVRGALITCQEVAQCIGCLSAYGVAYFISPNEHWRLLLFCAGIPAVLQGLGTLLLPESPRWLVGQKKVRKARIALERIAGRRGLCGRLPADCVDDEEETRNDFVDKLLESPSAATGSDLSRLSRVRATRLLLDRRVADLDRLMRSTALSLQDQDEQQLGEESEAAIHIESAAVYSVGEQPPLKVLLDLMEEEEVREEGRNKRRDERKKRDMEEFEASKAEGNVSCVGALLFKAWRILSPANSSLCRKIRSNITPLSIAVGCAAAQNLTGANTILYYSVDLMRMGAICDPLFTGVMIGVVKVTTNILDTQTYTCMHVVVVVVAAELTWIHLREL